MRQPAHRLILISHPSYFNILSILIHNRLVASNIYLICIHLFFSSFSLFSSSSVENHHRALSLSALSALSFHQPITSNEAEEGWHFIELLLVEVEPIIGLPQQPDSSGGGSKKLKNKNKNNAVFSRPVGQFTIDPRGSY